VTSGVAGALWYGWGFAGCGLIPAWRQGWRGPTLLVAAVVASFVLVFSSALLLALQGAPLGRGAWLGTLTALSIIACLLPGRRPTATSALQAKEPRPRWIAFPLLVACGLAWAVIAYRAVAQPLTGPDTIFRWDFLAHQVLGTQSLGFYPPVSDADFGRYMWPDGIPPLLPLLYAWSYMGAGSQAAPATACVVILVAALGFALVAMLAARAAGLAAAAWAIAVLAGSAVYTWSIAMGQETGLTTLGTLALAWALGDDESEPDWRLAGLAAGMTALSRDYGLAVPVVGAAYLAWRRRPWNELAGYVSVAGILAAPWYVRNWVRTGNPVYNIDVFGLFPVNGVHSGLMRTYAMSLGFGGHLAERTAELATLLWPIGAGLILASLAAMRLPGAWPVALRWLSAAWLFLWIGSVGYTAGGIGYSLRVLDPLLAMAAAAGGVALARSRGAWRGILASAVVLISAEASARALVMMRMPFGIPVASWLRVGDAFSAKSGDADVDRAAAFVGPHAVLVDDAYAYAFLSKRGVAVVPPWAPEVAFLCAPDIDMARAVRRLHALGVDYAWLSAARATRTYFGGFTFFDNLDPWVRPVVKGDGWVLFALVPSPVAGEVPSGHWQDTR